METMDRKKQIILFQIFLDEIAVLYIKKVKLKKHLTLTQT